jgi:hypothetical protein
VTRHFSLSDRFNSRGLYFVGLGLLLGIVTSVLNIYAIATISFAVLVLVHSITTVRTDESLGTVAVIIGIGICVRLAGIVLFPLYAEAQFDQMVLSSDSGYYHRNAQALASIPIEQWPFKPFEFIDREPGYTKVVAFLYKGFGPELVVPRFLNLIVTVPLLVYTYRLATVAFDRSVAELTTLTVALWPSLIFLTARTGHDIIAITLTVAALYAIVTLGSDGWSVRSVSLLVFCLGTLYLVRNQVAYILVVVLLIWIAVNATPDPSDRPRLALVALCAFCLVGMLSLVATQFQVGPFDEIHRRLNAWTIWFQNNKTGPGSGIASRIIGMPILFRFVGGAAIFGFVPFPAWKVLLSSWDIMARFLAASSLIMLCIFPFVIIGGIRSVTTPAVYRRLPLLLFVLTTWALIAGWYGGTTPRLRSQVIVFLLMFAATGMINARKFRSLIGLYSLLVAAAIMAYYYLKLIVGL